MTPIIVEPANHDSTAVEVLSSLHRDVSDYRTWVLFSSFCFLLLHSGALHLFRSPQFVDVLLGALGVSFSSFGCKLY